jgi:hypothetical protein
MAILSWLGISGMSMRKDLFQLCKWSLKFSEFPQQEEENEVRTFWNPMPVDWTMSLMYRVLLLPWWCEPLQGSDWLHSWHMLMLKKKKKKI